MSGREAMEVLLDSAFRSLKPKGSPSLSGRQDRLEMTRMGALQRGFSAVLSSFMDKGVCELVQV